MSSELTGGCLCGAVRFAATSVVEAGFCHCSTCRRHSGAPVSAWAEVARDDFRVTAGEPALFASSEAGRRAFCRDCGSVLWFADDREVSINAGALDDPTAIEPAVHICVEDQLPWLHLDDLLPACEGNDAPPADQRGGIVRCANPSVRRGDPISFREIDAGNLRDVLLLSVSGPQRRFVATNAWSLVQGLYAGDAWIRGIYAGDVAVGFIMAARLTEDELGLPLAGGVDLWRFMIDRRYQGLGFGGRALDMIIAELRGWPDVDAIWLGSKTGTGAPHGLYVSRGFVDTGVVDDGESIMKLEI